MYREYDVDTLHRVQNMEKQILEKFISICEKHGLTYFLMFGTLIGAVRHQGFIPWDDDIDVAMPRKDYERFLKIAGNECGEKYFLQTIETDENYHLFFAKLRMNDTKFVESSLQEADSVSGFFIDIFPYDTIPDDEKLFHKQASKADMLVRLLSANKVKEPQIGDYHGCVRLIAVMVWKILHYGMKLLHISGKKVWNSCERVYRKYQNETTDRMTCFWSNPEKWIVYHKEIEELITVPFEDVQVKIPAGYDAILTRQYGDYMTLPDEKDRVNHMPVVLKFPGEDEIRM